MTAVLAKGELAGAGTGVFIPSQNPGADSKPAAVDSANTAGSGEFQKSWTVASREVRFRFVVSFREGAGGGWPSVYRLKKFRFSRR